MRRFTRSIGRFLFLGAAVCCALNFSAGAFGQALLLNGWDDPNELGANTATHGALWTGANTNAVQPNGQGTTPINGDGPPLPFNLNGRWYVKDSNGGSPDLGSDVRLSHSTTVGVVNNDPHFPGSTGAMKVTQGGSSRGGGDSHYNFTAAGIFLYEPFDATGNVLLDDPRGDALRDARDNPSAYKFEFDATWDVENIIVRDPNDDDVILNNWFGPDPFVLLGIYMSNGVLPGGNNWLANDVLNPSGDGGTNILSGNQQFALADQDPSDAVGSEPVAPVTRHVAIRFAPEDWPILMSNGTGSLFQTPEITAAGTTGPVSSIAVGFVLNGNWANGPVTDPASAQSVYIDNLKLVQFDPIAEAIRLIDFNNDDLADEADWQIFIDNHLLPADTYEAGVATAGSPDPDLTGLECETCWWDKGDVDHDGDNDFYDFVAFESTFNTAHPAMSGGASAFERMLAGLAGVPEPSSLLLVALGTVGLGLRRSRWTVRSAAASLLVVLAVASGAQAQVTLLESWETTSGGMPAGIGEWESVGGGASDMIGIDTAHHTAGAQSLFIQHEEPGTTGSPDLAAVFYGAAVPATAGDPGTPADPQFHALANAVNLGPDLFRLKMDVIYDPNFLPQVTSVGVSMFLGSNTGSNRVGNTEETALVPWVIFDGCDMLGGNQCTIDVPLSAFVPEGGHIGDVEGDGTSQYFLQFGLNGTQTAGFPFRVFFDNLRLEQVADPDFLFLNVDRDTGEVTVTNTSGADVNLSYYEISSRGGGLVPGNWESFDDGESDPVATGWDEATNVSSNVLAELRYPTQGDATIANGAEPISLGFIYDTAMDTQDLVFQYRGLARPNKLIGGGPEVLAAPGDYNENGTVDAADYTTWRDALGQSIALPNTDPADVDAMVTMAEYTFWKNNFGNTGGLGPLPPDYLVVYSGGGGALAGYTVPEPAAIGLLVVAGLGLVWLRKR